MYFRHFTVKIDASPQGFYDTGKDRSVLAAHTNDDGELLFLVPDDEGIPKWMDSRLTRGAKAEKSDQRI